MIDILKDKDEGHIANNSHPFLLSNSQNIWYIKKGAVDIFALHYKDDKIIAPRMHLARISSGKLVFGLNDIANDKIKIIAVGIPDTEVVILTRERLGELTKDEKGIQHLKLWVEEWLKIFCSELFNHITSPKDYITINEKVSIDVKPEETVCNLNETAWIYSMTGSLLWYSEAITPEILNENTFPLIPMMWVKAKEDTKFSIMSTTDCIKQGLLYKSLDIFHSYLISYIIKLHLHEKKIAIENLDHKIEYENQALNLSLHSLANIVAPEKEKIMGDTGNALLDACRLVVKSMGIAIPSHLYKKKISQELLLEEFTKSSNLMMREISLTSRNWWEEDCGPLLVFIKENDHPVALIPRDEHGYDIVDPAAGTRTEVTPLIAKQLADHGMMFFRTFPTKLISLLELIKFGFPGTIKDLLRLLIMGMLGGLLAILVPFVTEILFDKIIPGNEHSQLFQVTILLITATVAIAIFEMARSIALLRIEGRLSVSTQAAMIQRLFSLPAPFFRRYSAGDLAQRAFATDSIVQLMTGTTQTAILNGIFSIFSGIYMFFISPPLALLASVLVIISVIIFFALNYWRLTYERQFSFLQGVVLNRIYQLLTGIAKIRIAGAEVRSFVLWSKEFGNKVTATINAQRIENYLLVFNALFIIIAMMVIFSYVGFTGSTISTGKFLAFNAAFIQFSMAILDMSLAFTNSINAIPLYERAKPILQTQPEVDETKISPAALRGDIEISHIAFRYNPEAPLILKDINIKIKQGESVAIAGHSSSGKSTILRLIIGLEKPESGAIYFDGHNLNELDVQAVRRQIGIVIQNAKLMPGDIYMNIVGSTSATLDDAWEAARLAGFDNDVRAMPMGMNTLISEGAGMISGGQRQRLLIARAIVNKPKIILFDEASSALDNITQAIVSKSLQELNATRVIIAHRLSTIMNADRIFVLNEGYIVETGTYEELMKKNGYFTELAKRQLIK